MKILVTGSSGFLGQALIKQLKKHGYTDIHHFSTPLSKNDISEPFTTTSVMNTINPDIVFHLAAIPNSKPSDPDPNRILKVNIDGTNNLLSNMKPGSKIIFASSIVVYGTSSEPMCECDIRNATSLYGATKSAGEELIKAYNVLNDIDYTIMRLGAMVGQGLTHGLLKDIIRKIESDSEYLELFGDQPGSCKPYTHVNDVTLKMVESLSNSDYHNQVLNVCNTNSISVEDVATIAMDVLKITKPIKWLGSGAVWKGDNKYLTVSNFKCTKISTTGFLSSEQSIKEAINDIKHS